MSGAQIWTDCVRQLEAARADEIAYDRATYTPRYIAWKQGGPRIPDEISAEIERLTDVRGEAEDNMVATPASNMSGVVYKIEYARRRWTEFEAWPDYWWDGVMSDLRRFAAQEI